MTEKNWLTVAYAAVVVAGLLLVAHFAFPVKPAGAQAAQNTRRDREYDASIKKLQLELTTSRAKNATRVWTQAADEIAAATMAKVTSLAQARGLRVVAFRPQRIQEDTGITRLPYQASLEGPFPQIIGFVQDLETSKFKTIVSTIQIASADGASDKVSSTIGLVAYREEDPKKP